MDKPIDLTQILDEVQDIGEKVDHFIGTIQPQVKENKALLALLCLLAVRLENRGISNVDDLTIYDLRTAFVNVLVQNEQDKIRESN